MDDLPTGIPPVVLQFRDGAHRPTRQNPPFAFFHISHLDQLSVYHAGDGAYSNGVSHLKHVAPFRRFLVIGVIRRSVHGELHGWTAFPIDIDSVSRIKVDSKRYALRFPA